MSASTSPDTSSAPPARYARRLGLFSSVMLVMGGTIGSGIFLSPAIVAQRVQTFELTLGVWVLGGLVAVMGALIYGELGARFPRAGGQYVYLREAFGELPAFLFAWGLLLMIATGAIAAVAVMFSSYMLSIFGGVRALELPIAVGAIFCVSLINHLGVTMGARTQNVLTVLKLVALAVVISTGLVFWGNAPPSASKPEALPTSPILAVGAALVPVLFSYSGWQQTNSVAEEIITPERNLPRALALGVVGVLVMYCGVNLAYLTALGPAGLAMSTTPASEIMGRLAGPASRVLLTTIIALSALGALNMAVMVTPRVYQALAADGLFFPRFARLHPAYQTPTAAIAFQACWAAMLTVSGRYGDLLDSVVFADWIAVGATAATLFVFRAREKAGRLPPVASVMPGYPILPLLFIAASGYAVVGSIAANPLNALKGTVLLGLGIPTFYCWRARRPK